MNVEVVAIGTELLLGQIVDTNSSWIGQELAAAGLNSHFQTKVGDNPDRIRTVLRQAIERSDAVICCGGLGPTQDDITRDMIAEMMGVELEYQVEIGDVIREMFESRGREMPEINLRQAMVPIGASILAEQPGTAPGLRCPVRASDGSERVLFAVPGVPYEMKEMMSGSVIPELRRRSGDESVIKSRVLRTWGASESGLAEILADRIDELDAAGNPTLAFLASGVEGLKVRITAKAANDDAVEAMLDAEQEILEPLIGHVIFGFDDENMEAVVIRRLQEEGLTLAVAESVTGGYVAGRLCAVPGASEVFRGAVVAYHPEVKFGLLNVPEGPVVSEEAAVFMAEGVRAQLGADIGLATTGVAGPGESEGKKAGTVCIAIARADGSSSVTLTLPGDRERIRQYSAISLLDKLRRELGDRHATS